VRYLEQGDAIQSRQVTQIIERQLTAERPGFISLVTMVETEGPISRQGAKNAKPANSEIICFGALGLCEKSQGIGSRKDAKALRMLVAMFLRAEGRELAAARAFGFSRGLDLGRSLSPRSGLDAAHAAVPYEQPQPEGCATRLFSFAFGLDVSDESEVSAASGGAGRNRV